ncbi:hypothetical protein HYW83_01420 [Candidatus Peregrinibacteria bacterium]|nr:hypothetical protein [Candidatus Peregrinibacteria bacterium]
MNRFFLTFLLLFFFFIPIVQSYEHSEKSSLTTKVLPMTLGGLRLKKLDENEIRGSYKYDEASSLINFYVSSNPKTSVATAKFWQFKKGKKINLLTVVVKPNLDSNSNDMGKAYLIWKKIKLDGFGSLTSKQEKALLNIAAGEYSFALPLISLELGCFDFLDNAIDDQTYITLAAMRAAVLFPWQMFIKYNPVYSNDLRAEYLEAYSECKYMTADRYSSPRPQGNALSLSNEDPFPNIFGIFPLDAIGGFEVKKE